MNFGLFAEQCESEIRIIFPYGNNVPNEAQDNSDMLIKGKHSEQPFSVCFQSDKPSGSGVFNF